MIKTTKDPKQATVITHGGIFHADEVFATVILSKVLGDLTVLRIFKVPENLNPNAIVYDVGLGEFDHHQKGGNGTRENGVPYASAGLLWRKYGLQVVRASCNPGEVFEMIDCDLIQGIDAVDNGVMPGVDYTAKVLSVSNVISGFNPRWDDRTDPDEAFLKAVEFASTNFENIFADANSKAKAKGIVEEAIKKSEGNIMILDRFVPWQEGIFDSDNPKAQHINYVIFPSNRGGYNWQCVPLSPGSFAQRKPVPSEWKGLNGTELQKVTGISSATFCHPAGFIGGADTLAGAIALAWLAESR